MSHQHDIKKLLRHHKRRLQKLKEREALEGLTVDPKIPLEIEDIEAKIEGLEEQLKELESNIYPESLKNVSKLVEDISTLNPVDTKSQRGSPPSKIILRAQPLEISEVDAKQMLIERDFYDKEWNNQGKGIEHGYQTIEYKSDTIVLDRATGLTWQQSGSNHYMGFYEATQYVQDLKKIRFAGFNDWRLPTLEEAMSLMEPEEKKGARHIDPTFDGKKQHIWTANKNSMTKWWVVDFDRGICDVDHVSKAHFVRAVR